MGKEKPEENLYNDILEVFDSLLAENSNSLSKDNQNTFHKEAFKIYKKYYPDMTVDDYFAHPTINEVYKDLGLELKAVESKRRSKAEINSKWKKELQSPVNKEQNTEPKLNPKREHNLDNYKKSEEIQYVRLDSPEDLLKTTEPHKDENKKLDELYKKKEVGVVPEKRKAGVVVQKETVYIKNDKDWSTFKPVKNLNKTRDEDYTRAVDPNEYYESKDTRPLDKEYKVQFAPQVITDNKRDNIKARKLELVAGIREALSNRENLQTFLGDVEKQLEEGKDLDKVPIKSNIAAEFMKLTTGRATDADLAKKIIDNLKNNQKINSGIVKKGVFIKIDKSTDKGR